MNIEKYDFEGGLERGFKALFEASNVALITADDIDISIGNEAVTVQIDTGGPGSDEHLNVGGEYDTYTGSIDIEVRTLRASNDQPTPIPVDAYIVAGAGTTAVNGTYVRNGNSLDGAPAYTLYDTDGTTERFSIWRRAGAAWIISENIDLLPAFYTIASSADKPPLSGWSVSTSGDPDAPTLSLAAPFLFKNRHVELVANARQLLEEIGATEISTYWPDAHAPTKIKPTGTQREVDHEFRYTRLSYEMQFRIT